MNRGWNAAPRTECVMGGMRGMRVKRCNRGKSLVKMTGDLECRANM